MFIKIKAIGFKEIKDDMKIIEEDALINIKHIEFVGQEGSNRETNEIINKIMLTDGKVLTKLNIDEIHNLIKAAMGH